MAYVSMKQMLETGVHFGHQTRRWNPKMRPFIFGARNGIHIIDLQQTVKLYRTAHDKIVETVANGGRVLFIGTKRQAQEAVAAEAGRAGQFHVTNRWMGGTLTNFATIQKSIERLKKLEAMFADGSVNRYQKKEILTLQREMAKLELTLGGIKEDMDRAEAYRVELRGREELAGLVDCSKMVAAICDKEGKVHLQYTHALAKDGALIGGVWGALIGFLFLNPLLGIVAGAGLGAATGEVGDFGISHRFMNELATHLKPGSSALFIPLKKEAVDETLRALGNSDGVVLSTDLKLEDEYQMEKLFEEMTAERAKKTS